MHFFFLTFVGDGDFKGSALQGDFMAARTGGHEQVISLLRENQRLDKIKWEKIRAEKSWQTIDAMIRDPNRFCLVSKPKLVQPLVQPAGEFESEMTAVRKDF